MLVLPATLKYYIPGSHRLKRGLFQSGIKYVMVLSMEPDKETGRGKVKEEANHF